MGEKKGVEIDKSSYYETVLKVMKMQATCTHKADYKMPGITTRRRVTTK
jgi:hypothetical protein